MPLPCIADLLQCLMLAGVLLCFTPDIVAKHVASIAWQVWQGHLRRQYAFVLHADLLQYLCWLMCISAILLLQALLGRPGKGLRRQCPFALHCRLFFIA